MLELVFAGVVIAGFLALLDRKDRRHAAEIQVLLQRIQAPEVAVAQHASVTSEPDETLPLSDDEMDDEVREAVERMEAMEREAAPWLP
jgi:hypothetical protein